MYNCNICSEPFTSGSLLANHVRWKHTSKPSTVSFHLLCCCIQCRRQITVQSLSSHLAKHVPKGTCKHCRGPVYTKQTFCSSSCSASYNNLQRDYTVFKPGPKLGSKPSTYIPYTKVSQCVVCKKWHKGNGKSCSMSCKKVILSASVKARIDNGWNPNENRNRSTPSFLEHSFECWLTSNQFKNYIKNKTFRCGSKLYFGDFFFPDLNILIELDGTQHKQSVDYDMTRDALILQYHNVYTVRISYHEYMKKTKIDLIKFILGFTE